MSVTNTKSSESAQLFLTALGMTKAERLANSLQGSIWKAQKVIEGSNVAEEFVAKIADKRLHNKSMALVNNQYYEVHEDIIAEGKILEAVTSNADCPKSIVKFNGLFESEDDICLVMENGGSSLFQFVLRAHKFIVAGQIAAKHWNEVCKVVSSQMIEAVEYIHSKGFAHFDISLENFLIKDVPINATVVDGITTIEFALDKIQVKLCDFGLAEAMPNGFKSNKLCGKTNYKAPELVAKSQFDAAKNDIWCLGICIFTLVFGANPWKTASPSDALYNCIYQRDMMLPVLQQWKLTHLVDYKVISMLKAVFKPEAKRATLRQMKAWLN